MSIIRYTFEAVSTNLSKTLQTGRLHAACRLNLKGSVQVPFEAQLDFLCGHLNNLLYKDTAKGFKNKKIFANLGLRVQEATKAILSYKEYGMALHPWLRTFKDHVVVAGFESYFTGGAQWCIQFRDTCPTKLEVLNARTKRLLIPSPKFIEWALVVLTDYVQYLETEVTELQRSRAKLRSSREEKIHAVSSDLMERMSMVTQDPDALKVSLTDDPQAEECTISVPWPEAPLLQDAGLRHLATSGLLKHVSANVLSGVTYHVHYDVNKNTGGVQARVTFP